MSESINKNNIQSILSYLYPEKLYYLISISDFSHFIHNKKDLYFKNCKTYNIKYDLTFTGLFKNMLENYKEYISLNKFEELQREFPNEYLYYTGYSNKYSISETFLNCYLGCAVNTIKPYKNIIIFTIIMLVYLKENENIDLNLFNDILFNKINKYNLTSNVEQTFLELFKYIEIQSNV